MPNPEERKSLFTDFKDPFDLLTDLHTTRLRMVYENTFARGNRSDMNMGYRERPSSSIGRVSSADYRLPINAPASEWQARSGSGGVLPAPSPINYSRDYGDPGIDRGEWKRFGSALRPIGAAAQKLGEDFYERRKKARYQPLIDRLENVNKEMADTRTQMEDIRLGMSETRMQARHRGQEVREERARQKEEKAKSKGAKTTPAEGAKDFNKEGNTMALQLELPLNEPQEPEQLTLPLIPPHLENRADTARKKARENKGPNLVTAEPDTPLVTPEDPPASASPRTRSTPKPSLSAPPPPPKVKEKGETLKKRRPALKQTPWQ